MNPLLGMLGIDVDDFKVKMEQFLEFVQSTLSAIDTNIKFINEKLAGISDRQERIETKLDKLLKQKGEIDD